MGVGKSSCLSSPYSAQNTSARKHDTDICREHVRTNNQWDENSWKHRAKKSRKTTSLDDSARTAREINHSKHSGKSMFLSTNEVKPSPPTTSNKLLKDPYQMFTSESSCSVTQTNGQDVKQQHQKGTNKVSATFDEKENSPMLTNANNADLEKYSRNHAKRLLPRNVTYSYHTQYPRSNDESTAINALQILPLTTEAWSKIHSGSETKQSIDETDGDQNSKTNKEKEKERLRHVAREADDVKRITGDENHAVNSSNDTNKTSEYERNIKTSEYERDIKKLEARVRQLTYEKDGLLSRLSEIQAINLTENNPNITDLSDASRPQKIEEQFSELYDNEWTDAYEYLTNVRNGDTDFSAKQLLQILQEVYTICMSSTNKKKKALQKALTNYVGLTKEDQEEFDLKDIQKRLREYRTKKLVMNIKKIGKEVEDKLKSSFTPDTLKDLSTYTGRCVSICWGMCTKEPPMFLDFCDSNKPTDSGNKKSTKIRFDKDKFRSYKMFGDYIDYVVWPALYLAKDGPCIKKGVAQGIQEDREYEYERDRPE